MPAPPRLLLAALVAVALLPQGAPAAAPPFPPPPGADRHGDCLPTRAVARLGKARFHHRGAHWLTYSPDGTVLASADRHARVIHLWHATTGDRLARLQALDPVWALAFSRDGRVLASGHGSEQAVRLWDPGSGRLFRLLEWPHGPVGGLGFSRDGRALTVASVASIEQVSAVRTYDLRTGKVIEQSKAWAGSSVINPRRYGAVAVAADGTVAIPSPGMVMLWGAADRVREEGRKVAADGANRAGGLTFSGDGKVLAFFRRNARPHLWGLGGGGRPPRPLKSPSSPAQAVGLSQEGNLMAIATTGRKVEIWEVLTARLRCTSDRGLGRVNALAFTPDGKALAVAQEDEAIRVVDVATGTDRTPGLGVACRAVAFTPDGRAVVTGCADHTILFWEASTGRPMRSLAGHTDQVWALTLSRDGKLLASSSRDGTILLWDVGSGRPRRSIRSRLHLASSLVLSPDERVLAAAYESGWLSLWDVHTGKELATWRGGDRPGLGLAFSPDGKALFSTGRYDGEVRVWDVSSRKLLRAWKAHEGDIALSLSPDGKTLASGGVTRPALKLWESGTGKDWVPASFTKAPDTLAVAFGPDGQRLASAGADGTVLLWDVATGALRRRLAGHQDQVRALAFSPRGDRLASVSADGTALVWDITGRAGAGPVVRPGVRPDEVELQALCRDLGGDTARALASYRALVAAGAPAARHLGATFPTPRRTDPKLFAQLLHDLDGDDFAKRQAAQAELAKRGEQVEPALREALGRKPSLETRRRIERLLAALDRLPLAKEMRPMRAVWALEEIGTAEARRRLREVARGGAGGPVLREAAAALERLEKAKP
jgi:WD40 repeat protein